MGEWRRSFGILVEWTWGSGCRSGDLLGIWEGELGELRWFPRYGRVRGVDFAVIQGLDRGGSPKTLTLVGNRAVPWAPGSPKLLHFL